MPSAPRIDPRLHAALARIDDGRLPVAEVNRRLGAVASHLGLPRPSYEQVRILLGRLRHERSGPSTADILLDVAFRARPPTDLEELLKPRVERKRRRRA
jgi:hypothetical protein